MGDGAGVAVAGGEVGRAVPPQAVTRRSSRLKDNARRMVDDGVLGIAPNVGGRYVAPLPVQAVNHRL